MCTAMTIRAANGTVYFGRTMDFSYQLDPKVYVVPRGFEWINELKTCRIRSRYRFIGIGQDISKVTFADGVNEMGFAAAVLYFPGFAAYEPADGNGTQKTAVAAIELVNFLLGMCASVEEVPSVLSTIRIVGTQDSVTNTIAPLHWITVDRSGSCMVIEQTEGGLKLLDNPIGVLSNSPDFGWHMTKLRNYMNVNPKQSSGVHWGSVELPPFGQGGGTAGLPGDYTPPSRFVRTAFLKSHVPVPEGKEEAVNTCFHVMEGVTIPRGAVVTDRGTDDYTQYTAFMNVSEGEYFIKTYDNSSIVTASLWDGEGRDLKPESLGKLVRPARFEPIS